MRAIQNQPNIKDRKLKIEIGVCDFDTEGLSNTEDIIVLVEPMKEYLDNIPNKENVIKINKAISDKKEERYITYIDQEVLSSTSKCHKFWLRGSSSLREEILPAIQKLIDEGKIEKDKLKKRNIECIDFKELIETINIDQRVDSLKVDTEGFDELIMNSVLGWMDDNYLITNIKFEVRFFTRKNKNYMCKKLYSLGYKVEVVGHDMICKL